jgi:hypothetical protein
MISNRRDLISYCEAIERMRPIVGGPPRTYAADRRFAVTYESAALRVWESHTAGKSRDMLRNVGFPQVGADCGYVAVVADPPWPPHANGRGGHIQGVTLPTAS